MVDSNNVNNANSALGIFTREVKGAAVAGIAMAGELLNANQSLSAYTSALDNNSKILGSFGKVINGLTKFAEESLAEYQTLSGIGATFGKEMANIKISAAQLGLNVKDMTDLFMKNNDSLRTFGGTTDVAISSFTRLSKTFLDSNFGTELRRMGYTAADINETLLVYNELAQQDGLNRTRSTQKQIESARDFAVELDGLAKLTGKQRKELADEMKARRREGDVQAFLMGQSAEAQEAFMMATQKIKETMGPQFEELFQDLLIRGAPITEDTRNAFIALGGSADEFEATVANFRRGMDTKNFDAFNDSITAAQGAFLNNLKTDEARTMAMQSGLSGVATAMADAYDSSYNFANAVDASADGQESATETIKRLQTQISEEQLKQMATTGGLLDKTIQMQEALREFTIAATTEVLPRLEAMAVRGIDMFLERLPSAEQMAAQLAGGVDRLLDAVDRSTGNPFNDFANMTTAGDQGIMEGVGEVEGAVRALGGTLEETADTTVDEVTSELDAARAELERLQTESDAAREAAEAELASAQTELQSLTQDGFHGSIEAIDAAQQRVQDAETALQSTIESGNARVMEAVQRAATAFTNSRVAEFQSTGNAVRGFAEGGNIRPGELAIVGEAGPEFVNGPANVTSARKSMGVMQNLFKGIEALDQSVQAQTQNNTNAKESMSVMQNLFKGIKALDQSVQTQTQNNTNAISNNNNAGNLEKKYDTMIALLSELVNVEVAASTTAQKTYKATKGLQGNMIRGLGI